MKDTLIDADWMRATLPIGSTVQVTPNLTTFAVGNWHLGLATSIGQRHVVTTAKKLTHGEFLQLCSLLGIPCKPPRDL